VKVILLEEVKKLGKKGEVVEVAEGYARNYLLPRKLAVPATSDAINTIKQQQAAEARKAQRQLEEAKMLAAQLAKLTVTIPVKTGEGGKLFGSVTAKDIADALAAQHKFEIDKRKIELKEAIKAVGSYTVTLKIHPEVAAQLEVKVVSA